ncbi:MAG: alpha/beta fold hydrolase [Ruminiclostridium sp.]|nr:alpha/beta fold hydrolase [Ruminiclostridium sp.]
MKKIQGFFPSSNGINRIAYYITVPDGKPSCIVQLAHGMCENALLYKRLMHFLTARGCVVCANDFLGHGRSVQCPEDVGFFAPQNGWRCIIRDMKMLTDIVSDKFKGIPVILVGHSMGSFATREYLTWYGDDISGCVLVGTSDGFESRKLLKLFAQGLCLYEKGAYHAPCILKAGCSFFSGKTAENKDKTIWAWLTRDKYVQELVARHSFDYTARAYCDIITLLDVISAPDWAYSIPVDLPIMLMSGNCDAVGECGKGVARLYRRMRRAGCKKIKVRLYGGARHMLLHETNRLRVYNDLYDWIKKTIEESDGK